MIASLDVTQALDWPKTWLHLKYAKEDDCAENYPIIEIHFLHMTRNWHQICYRRSEEGNN